MSLDADFIVDRRRLRRRLLFWRLLAILSLTAVAAVVAFRYETPTFGGYIARLDIDGVIVDNAARDQALAAIAGDGKARALIVRIDSPGGTVVGGESLYRAIRAVAKNKPVVAVMGTTATSAAYMAAIAADRIIARDSTITGSIGVLMQTANITGLLSKIGITPETIKSGPLKAQPNPFEATTPAARAAIQGVVMDMYAMFVDMVAERRAMARAKALKLADGRIYTGRQALAAGLIDALGGRAEALKWLTDADSSLAGLPVRPVTVERQEAYWRRLFDGMIGKSLFSERLRLDGLISLWQPEGW